MKRRDEVAPFRSLLAIAVALVTVLAGCWPAARLTGGPAIVMSDPAPAKRSTLRLVIKWPMGPGRDLRGYHAQLIPDSTSRVDVTVTNSSDEQVGFGSVTRNTGEATTSVDIEVPWGSNFDVKAEAFPPTNGPANNTGPIASGTSAGLNVNANFVSASVTMSSLYVPEIESMNFNAGEVGDTVTLTGDNLSPLWAAVPTVVFHNATASTVVRNSASSITVTVPTGAETDDILVVTDGVESVSSALYWVVEEVSLYVLYPTQVRSRDVPEGMTWYGGPMVMRATADFAIDGNDIFSAIGSTPPDPVWTNGNAANVEDSRLDSQSGAKQWLAEIQFTAASSHEPGNVTASWGSADSNAILLEPAGVDTVTISPNTSTINAMPALGSVNPAFTVEQLLTVAIDTTLPFDEGVDWYIFASDTGPVLNDESTESVKVTTGAGAPAGYITIAAQALSSQITSGTLRTATVSVDVTDYGNIVLEVD